MAESNEQKADPKTVCCIIAFVFIFILLIGAIVWCNCSSVDQFTDVINASNDNIKNKIKGGKMYNAMTSNDDIGKMMKLMDKKGQRGVIAILADWCGYCKQLKKSGTLCELSKYVPVHVMTDKHPQSVELMKSVKAGGFPTLILYGQGKVGLYEGPRDTNSILSKLK